ncbi:4-hydroxythreonine-4-phosphate dehydrogenase PdxA [Paracoccaceae bacterium]|nr:4-hydroxythreonine-4-phosphate dehydrogenase PdxA [Paracoccaceae bacterium]
MNSHKIILTTGDPAGIGPEVLLKSYLKARNRINLIAISDFDKIGPLAQKIGVEIRKVNDPQDARYFRKCLNILHLQYPSEFIQGQFCKENAYSIIQSIKIAADLCLNNDVGAMVTGPINKHILNKSSLFNFKGHTDYLESITQSKKGAATMMMVNPSLKIIPLTIHEPLNKVSKYIKKSFIEQKLISVYSEMKRYQIDNPKIAILGLNPHAGENGNIGTEEISEIIPAIKTVNKLVGNTVKGPFSADGFFGNSDYTQFDVIVAMYHDQALIPLKLLNFKKR